MAYGVVPYAQRNKMWLLFNTVICLYSARNGSWATVKSGYTLVDEAKPGLLLPDLKLEQQKTHDHQLLAFSQMFCYAENKGPHQPQLLASLMSPGATIEPVV